MLYHKDTLTGVLHGHFGRKAADNREEQEPLPKDRPLLDVVCSHFASDKYGFEQFAADLWTSSEQKVDKIDVSMDLKIETTGESQTKLKLKDAEAGGEILWDNSAGRPVESVVSSSITIVIELNGMSAEQGVSTKMKMKQVAASNAREL